MRNRRLGGVVAAVLLLALDIGARAEPRPARASTWLRRSVVYGVIPRNFGPRGAKDVTARLDKLKGLGVGTLWLSPIMSTPPGDFGYAVTDFEGLRPDFGTKQDLKVLVREAHKRGIRVLLDFVPNHTSNEHPWFKDAEARGPASPTYDFYDRDAQGKPTSYFGWTHLPNLNYANPKVRRAIVDAMAYWVKDFDVDGFRLDVAWGVRQRRPQFWREALATLRRIKPEVALLAEASARDGYYGRNGFAASYDWTDNLGEWAWQDVFKDRGQLVSKLHAALTNGGKGYPKNAHVLRFLNNNDTGKRFVTQHGVPMTRAAVGLLMTLPGTPLVYTGDEVGAEFHPYFDGARPIAWTDSHGLEAWYTKMIGLRDRIPALRGKGFRALPFGPAQTTYAYLRWARKGGSPALVLVNFGKPESLALDVPGGDARWRDAVDGHTLLARAEDGKLRVSMPDHGVRVLVPTR
jgi:cyclomaltodextrinase / maltogenic alpha-amylase / neopullulanase